MPICRVTHSACPITLGISSLSLTGIYLSYAVQEGQGHGAFCSGVVLSGMEFCCDVVPHTYDRAAYFQPFYADTIYPVEQLISSILDVAN
jgi:hypothetical protein